MRVKVYNFLALVSLICLICVGVVIFSEVTGLRQKYEAQRLQAEAQKIEAQTEKMETLPLVVSALVDTAMAVIYAVSDRLLLIALVVYILIAKGGYDERQEEK